jgi:putative endopeptidase
VYLSQGGLGLPDRDYYLTPQFAAQKAAYRDYIARTLRMVNWPNADAAADAIVALETSIAQVSWSKVDQRDDEKMYNPRTKAEIAAMAPGFDWTAFFREADLGGVDRVVVGEITAIPQIAAIFAAADVPTLQAWQAFTTIDSAAPYLSKRFVDNHFDFRSKTLNGVPEQRVRWKRGVAAVENALGESVGKMYVEKYFPPEYKREMETLVENLRVAMRKRIEANDWMGPGTKAEALKKLAAMGVKIGYPDKWRDYSALKISPDDLFGNMERSVAYEWAYDVERLDEPVDEDEWYMTPQTVNAYYDPIKNEIGFPAAFLQPPNYDPKADLAVNYGGIGATIGHEITHGFDDSGRRYDAEGRLNNWWTEADAARFTERAKVLGAQFSAFEPFPGMRVNGELTMGENIADLGGLIIAYEAYKTALGGKAPPVIDGLTGDQRFFLAYAQSWLTKRRDDAVKQQLVSDPHAPEIYRTNGPVMNMVEWQRAFGVKPGDPMFIPPERMARIW